MTDAPPLLLLVGPPGHGVTRYGADVASAVLRRDDRAEVASVPSVVEALPVARGTNRVHLHVTDRILGASPEDAATSIERLAAVTNLTITVHDVPQTSDGTMFPRRVAAYSRFFAAADAVVVNSAHEQQLVREFLPDAGSPWVIPLGARVPQTAPPATPAPLGSAQHPRDLVVLIAGYVYPGKGHAAAARAAASAGDALRAAGEPVGDVAVRAIGRPSAGHEREVEELQADAGRLGVKLEVTGFLEDAEFTRQIAGDGIPLAAHEHVSASRSMLDWVEAGRRPLVVQSRYAAEMASLRPGTMTLYEPEDLARRLLDAWRDPESTRLPPATPLRPTVDDAAGDYLSWWRAEVPR